MRPVLDVSEQYDLTLNRRERAKGGKESRAQIRALEITNRRIGPICGDRFVERHEAPTSVTAKSVQRSSVNDREEPRSESVGAAAGGELFVGVHEGLLRDVVGVGGITEDGESARERGTPIATHQLRKRVLFSRQCAVNQFFVGRLGRHLGNRTPARDEA